MMVLNGLMSRWRLVIKDLLYNYEGINKREFRGLRELNAIENENNRTV